MAKQNPKKHEIVLELKDVSRKFVQGETTLEVLKGASLSLHAGEIISIVGPSGCGKSTLLQLSGLLEYPSAGSIAICGQECTHASDAMRTRLRREKIGFIYQFHHLLPEFSALENVILPQMIARIPKKRAAEKAKTLLTKMGLGERLNHRPTELSGGEQQRVAIARALANDPKILLADEPTGNLDPETAKEVFQLLLRQVREQGVAMMMVTHDAGLAARTDKVFRIENGKLLNS